MAGRAATLTIKILADAKQAQQGLDQAASKTEKFQKGIGKASLVAAGALAGMGAAAFSMAGAAAEDAAAADQLALALKNATGASDEGVASVEDWISKTSEATAVSDDQLRPALATLARATGDVSKSQDALALALDISAATGKDVESVSAALAKGYAGNTASLGRLIPGLDKATLASKDMEKITAELARTTGGAAAKAAKSTAGQMKGMQIAFDEAQEELGSALLPAMTSFAKILKTAADFVKEHSTVVLILAGVIATLSAGIIAVNAALKLHTLWVETTTARTKIASVATKAWAAAQWLLNAAFSPIGLIVIAIAALVAAIVLLWKKNETFRKVVTAVWQAVLNVIKGVWQWIQSNVAKLFELLTKPFRLYLSFVRTVISTVLGILRTVISWVTSSWSRLVELLKGPFETVKGFISRVVQTYIDLLKTVVTWVTNSWSKLTDLIVNPIKAAADLLRWVVDGIRSVFETAFGWILKAIEKVSDALGKVKDFGKGVIDAINPFSVAPPPVAGVATPRLRAVRTSTTSSGSSGRNVIVNVNGAIDPQQTARTIQKLLRDADVRSGVRRFA